MHTVMFIALLAAVPHSIRAAAPGLDGRLARRWPRLTLLTFQGAGRP